MGKYLWKLLHSWVLPDYEKNDDTPQGDRTDVCLGLIIRATFYHFKCSAALLAVPWIDLQYYLFSITSCLTIPMALPFSTTRTM
jgi:hypothetical protein